MMEKRNLDRLEIAESIERLRLSGFTGGERVMLSVAESKRLMTDVMAYLLGGSAVWKDDYDAVADWMYDNRGKGLLMMGPCGTGKSLLGGKVVPVVMHRAAGFICAQYSARELNGRYGEIVAHKIVYIDDVGTEPMYNDYGTKRMVFSELVDEAERRDMLLIASTNLDAAHLTERYGERTVDRLRSLTRLVQFDGRSLRK